MAEKDSGVSPLNPYTVTVARGVTENAAHIDDLISAHLQGWTLERLPAVDRALYRVPRQPLTAAAVRGSKHRSPPRCAPPGRSTPRTA